MGIYDDMLEMEHPTSTRHPRMPEMDRAAQFAPFAALTGYDRIIVETGRLTDERKDLDETRLYDLNSAVNELMSGIHEKPSVELTRFVPDRLKDGGEYVKVSGSLREIDPVNRVLVMSDHTRISLDDIFEIKIM